jgi:hypothetical protein
VGLTYNHRRGPYLAEVEARYSERSTGSGDNLFARFAYLQKYLHRYRTTYFVAFGDRATTDTAKRIEFGVEATF